MILKQTIKSEKAYWDKKTRTMINKKDCLRCDGKGWFYNETPEGDEYRCECDCDNQTDENLPNAEKTNDTK